MMLFENQKWMTPVLLGILLVIVVIWIIIMTPDSAFKGENSTNESGENVSVGLNETLPVDEPAAVKANITVKKSGGSSSGGGGGGGSSSTSSAEEAECDVDLDCDDDLDHTEDLCEQEKCIHNLICPVDSDGGVKPELGGTCGTEGAPEFTDYCEGNILHEFATLPGDECIEGCYQKEIDCTSMTKEGDWICVADGDGAYCEFQDPWNEEMNCMDANFDGLCDVDKDCANRCESMGYFSGFCKDEPAAETPEMKEFTCSKSSGTYEPLLESKCEGDTNLCCCADVI